MERHAGASCTVAAVVATDRLGRVVGIESIMLQCRMPLAPPNNLAEPPVTWARAEICRARVCPTLGFVATLFGVAGPYGPGGELFWVYFGSRVFQCLWPYVIVLEILVPKY